MANRLETVLLILLTSHSSLLVVVVVVAVLVIVVFVIVSIQQLISTGWTRHGEADWPTWTDDGRRTDGNFLEN